MIERHVTFDVFPDQAGAFEQFFQEEYRPAMSKMPGFIRADLLQEQETPGRYQMVIRFESGEAAAHWRASTEHQALSPRLKSMYSESHLQVYEVVA